MLSGEYALLELEVYAILAQYFREHMALHLINIVEYRVSEYEVTFVCWMSMQIQV